MKHLITAVLIIFAATTQAQSYQVFDTIYANDTKLLLAYEIQDRAFKSLQKVVDNEKANTDTIVFFDETKQFYIDLRNAVNKFAVSHLVIDTLSVDSVQFDAWVTEYQELSQWITDVQADPDIQDAISLSVFKRKTSRRAKLLSYYRQIQNQ